MFIIQMASEMAPAAKVGGLADVVLGLTRELTARGHRCEVIIPKYDCLDANLVHNLRLEVKELWSYFDGRWHSNSVWAGEVEGLKVYFIEAQNDTYFFERGRFYGCSDDIERFLYFSRAGLEFLLHSKLNPDIVHLHDWETGASAPLLKDMYREMGLADTRLVFTIHNIEYQGWASAAELGKTGLHGPSYLTLTRLQDNYHSKTINLLKGGVVYSDQVTTVSPTYAEEVTTAEGGRGMHPTLKWIKPKFTGILNAIDYHYWNPDTDPFLAQNYSAVTPEKKAQNKAALREKLQLEESDGPLMGSISRLVPQKGIELIKYALFRAVEQGGQFVLLGSSPTESINRDFHALKQRFATNPHVHLELNHNEELAHLIYSGSDMFIVPSIFEPCGLTQLIALRYGSIPIVRKTGGLADTVFDVDFADVPEEKRNGFVFEHPNPEALDTALLRAFQLWEENPLRWQELVIHGMNMDHSWTRSAIEYEEVYQRALEQEPAS